MINRNWTTILAALGVVAACAWSRADGPQWSERKTEAQCIEILKNPGAELNDKFAACRHLAVAGKKDAIHTDSRVRRCLPRG